MPRKLDTIACWSAIAIIQPSIAIFTLIGKFEVSTTPLAWKDTFSKLSKKIYNGLPFLFVLYSINFC